MSRVRPQAEPATAGRRLIRRPRGGQRAKRALWGRLCRNFLPAELSRDQFLRLLAEDGDRCEIKNSYIRNGRMSAQMSCKRDGMSGDVMPAMMGTFSNDGFEGDITTLTYFIKDGDYRLTRKVTAKRIGDCPAEPTAG